MLHIIDTHAHLDLPDFDDDREAVIQRAQAAGVGSIINVGSGDGLAGAKRSLALTDRFSCIHAAVGLHPHDAKEPPDLTDLRKLARHSRVVAIGETGLDFYRNWAPRETQRSWFRAQIELALELQKPLIIHSREAGAECLKILEEMGAAAVGGVFHCYAEDASFAERLRSINFLVSIPGLISFKKAAALRTAVKDIPLEQIMLETDAPFLAPEPHRGHRCESAFIVETAKHTAEVKGVALEELVQHATRNAKRLFRID